MATVTGGQRSGLAAQLQRTVLIRVPLLLLHGSADPAVPPEQSAALAAAVAANGTPVEHHVYEGEGHGWSRPETVRDELGRVERFLQRWVLDR